MATVLDSLIVPAMQDLGAIALGETPTDAEAEACFKSLNAMMETWNTESLLVYNIAPQTFAYVPGKQSYTMGTGGDFNTSRPIKITEAKNRGNAGTASEVDYDIYVTNNSDEYADIVTKRISTTLPTVVYYDGNFPLQTLYFWPIPSATTYAPVLWSWGVITSFASIDTALSLPPGYQRALQKNLSLEIAPAFGREPSPSLASQAVESKAQLQRINYTVNELQLPYGIPGTDRPIGLAQFLAGIP